MTDPSASAAFEAPPPPPSSGRPAWLVPAVIGALVFLIVVLVFLLVSSDDGADTATSVDSTEQPGSTPDSGSTVDTSSEESAPVCSEFTETEDLPLALCDSGEFVTTAQAGLNSWGAQIDADGFFGPATEAAVKDFQTASQLESDGIIGPDTWDALCPYTDWLCEPDG